MAGKINFKKPVKEKPKIGDYIVKENGDVYRIICKYVDNGSFDAFYLLREEDGYIEDFSESTSIDDLLFDTDYVRIVRNNNTRLEEI